MNFEMRFHGEIKIPEEKIPELTQRMIKVFEQGGLMGIEDVSLFGKQIKLLKPLEIGSDDYIQPEYSYFGDSGVGRVAYNAKTGVLSHFEFDSVGFGRSSESIIAGYMLSEFYTEEYGLVTMGNHFLAGAWRNIAWINYLFDENYQNTRLREPWHLYKVIEREARYLKEDPLRYLSYVPSEVGWVLAGVVRYLSVAYTDIVRRAAFDLSAYQELRVDRSIEEFEHPSYIGIWASLDSEERIEAYLSTTAPESLRTAAAQGMHLRWIERYHPQTEDAKISFCHLVDMCALSLEELLAARTENCEALFDRLCSMLRDHETACTSWEDAAFPFWFASYLLPKEATLKLIADAFNMDFWKLVDDLGTFVNEKSAEWCESAQEDASALKAVKMSTAEILSRTYDPISDDDRAYFWKEDGDVFLSEEMLEWLRNLEKELDEIESEDGDPLKDKDFFRTFLEVLSDVDRDFDGVHFFREAFYDFLARYNERRVRVAVELIRRMSKRNCESFRQWKESSQYGSFLEECPPAKREIKRFFAVLGNPALREKWLKL